MLTDNLSQRSKGSRMKCLFTIQALFVPLLELLRLGTSSPVQKEVKSRFLRFENRIVFLLTFAGETKGDDLPLTSKTIHIIISLD